MKEMVGGCCVCADENGWTDNPLIYCDGENCEVAVHQGCYGIQEVPEGEWLCAKCTAASSMNPGSINEASFCCELCPFDYGALKPTDTARWAHVICALYIPEVRFGDVHSMDPVILSDVPLDKFNKSCYICNEERPEEAKKGACMSCNKTTCKRSFHVTCAQRKGLLCEEGAISRNVKYCGYCEQHLKKAINDPAIKVIPACPPVQRVSKEPQDKKKSSISQSTLPPSQSPASAKPSHMLVEPLPRPDQVNSVLGLGPSKGPLLDERPSSGSLPNPSSFSSPPATFSPPLTTSSRSSVALEPTPPLSTKSQTISSGPLIPASLSSAMANGTSSETTVGTHCLQQLQHIQNTTTTPHTTPSQATLSELNGYPGPAQLTSFMHEIPARNTTSVASLLPPGAADYHLNGSGDEEKTVKAVLTAPLAKAKRMRDSKNENILDKAVKRPRAHGRTPAVLGSASNSSSGGTVGKSPSMQRLMHLVAPVVSEVVTDFQRDRVADRTAAERRAAVAQSLPSTSTNGTAPVPVAPVTSESAPVASAPNSTASHTNNVIPAASIAAIPGTSNSESVTQNGSSPSTNYTRHNIPTFMEQLLERQWDQGSSLLTANAHFDVAQLLKCLFQLKSENFRLEENLSSLRKRRDHLYTLNTRLAEVNTLDVPKRQRESLLQQNSTELVPKVEAKVEHSQTHASSPTMSGPIAGLLEEMKLTKAVASTTTASRKNTAPVASTTPVSVPAASLITNSSTPSSGALTIPNNRTTPSTAAAPLAPTPVLATAAANEMALSPERLANLQQTLGMYRHMAPLDVTAAQLAMAMGNFPNQLNQAALYTRLLAAQPSLASIINQQAQALAPTSQPLTTIPPTSVTPNGK